MANNLVNRMIAKHSGDGGRSEENAMHSASIRGSIYREVAAMQRKAWSASAGQIYWSYQLRGNRDFLLPSTHNPTRHASTLGISLTSGTLVGWCNENEIALWWHDSSQLCKVENELRDPAYPLRRGGLRVRDEKSAAAGT